MHITCIAATHHGRRRGVPVAIVYVHVLQLAYVRSKVATVTPAQGRLRIRGCPSRQITSPHGHDGEDHHVYIVVPCVYVIDVAYRGWHTKARCQHDVNSNVYTLQLVPRGGISCSHHEHST